MKKLFTLLVLSITFSMNAQWSYNSTSTGIQSSTNDASGSRAIAMGGYTTASGDCTTAMGRFTTASGNRATAMGGYTTASGIYSTAMGYYTTASDYVSTVIGQYNSSGSSATSATSFSTSNTAFVIGNGADSSNKSDAFKVMFNGDTYVSSSLYLAGTAITATAAEINLLDGVTAVGSGILSSVTENGNTGVRLSTSNTSNHGDIGSNAVDLSYSSSSSSTRGASGNYAVAMGRETTASGNYSTAMGRETTASGKYSISMGRNTTASDFGSTVIGRYNSSGSSVTNSATSFSTSNTAFVIGNGADSSNKSDAFKVMFNGDATVSNDLTVSGDVVISSDARLKSNVVSLGSTLPKLLQIDGKSYEMKGKQKIGVLAQEIKEVFPELVSEDDNEMLAVNYQGLVPVLINALKEQQIKYIEQEKRLERLERLVASMD